MLGLYGGNDARVNATIPPADSALRALGRTYVYTSLSGSRPWILEAADWNGRRKHGRRPRCVAGNHSLVQEYLGS